MTISPHYRVVVKRVFYNVIKPLRRLYWFVARPDTLGVKCLIEHEGKFLCIRNSYYPYWTFPGGGVNEDELPVQTAQREAFEEVGIDIAHWKEIGEYESRREHKKDVVYCFYAQVSDAVFQIDNDEVIEACWFSEDEIPENQSFAVEEVLRLYKTLR